MLNLQTTKPRARWVNNGYPGFKGWIISHPGTMVQLFARLPHDDAALLLKKYVLLRAVKGNL